MKNIVICTSSFDSKNICKYSKKINLKFNKTGRKLESQELLNLIDNKTIGIISGTEKITSDVLQKAKNLQVISRCGTGIDNIDPSIFNTKIKIFTTSKEPILSVAEFVLTQILSVLKNNFEYNYNLKRKIWRKNKGNLLSLKKFGFIGYGKIGKQLKKLISPFNCKIFIYDRNIEKFNKKNLLKKILKECDFITLNIPFNKNNKNFIDQNKIKLMKSNSIFVNCARGGLVDEDALYQKLKKNPHFKAILDCFSKEPYYGKLIKLDNVMLSPHASSFTKEGRDLMEKNSFLNCIRNIQI